MTDCKELLRQVGISIPALLLPSDEIDLRRFAVIACDQFSAEPDYWQRVQETVDGKPSALNLILPEAFLQPDNLAASQTINANMRRYLSDGTLQSIGECFVYLERETSAGLRKGLIVALDLEQYDFSPQASSLIRATEQTVPDRLPPRIQIREHAPLELPHVMVLLDDPDNTVIGAVEQKKAELSPLYDFELMLGGGRLTGYRVADEGLCREIANALHKLLEDCEGLLYAMGDGNHSFAAAKACWEQLKPTLSQEEKENHPARYSLVELVNLYDEGVYFEPIHRLLYHVDPLAVQQELGFDAQTPPSLQVLQPMLDEWLSRHPEAELEYIHGAEECQRLAEKDDRLAILFPPFDKQTVFRVVRQDGCFVRKSFSIGHAVDKRYYLECRKIK